MSDGLHNLVAAPSEITLAGVTLRLSKLTLAMHGQIEAHLLAAKPDPVAMVVASLDKLPSSSRERYGPKLIEAAVKQATKQQSVSPADVSEFLNSFAGTCYLLWMMCREHHPEYDTSAKLEALVSRVELSDIQRKLDQASGMVAVKNSDGPAETTGP